MLINELKELRGYMGRFQMTTKRADSVNPETGVKTIVVQLFDCQGCAWRTGRGENVKAAWQDLLGKVWSSNRPPRKPSKAALTRVNQKERS